MNDPKNWKVPKLPFLIVNALLLAFAYFIIWRSPHPISFSETVLCISACVLGSAAGILPFILDYRAMGKIMEVNALGAVAEKIQNLEALSAQIQSATNVWATVQETVHTESAKTSGAAKQIADRMSEEVRRFNEFMQQMNDSEKATLRLEVEKFRRSEAEWLQVLVRILDHVFALHNAAVRSGDAKFSAPITDFQNACRGTARRVGLTPFAAEPNEPFNAERHQVAGSDATPAAGALVGETVGAGYTYQGRMLRPALVRLSPTRPPVGAASAEISAPDSEPDNLEGELSLGAAE